MAFNLPSIVKSKGNLLSKKDINIDNIFDDFLNTFYEPVSFNNRNDIRNFNANFDISESKDGYHIELDLPGFEEKNVDINLKDNLLTIKGKREESSENKDKNYFTKERFYGEFQRSITLPNNINSDKIEAKYKNGVLEINVPKKESKNMRKIEIQVW